MKWSSLSLKTYKEVPADAELVSHQLLLRGSFIKKVSQGIFTYGYLALRSIHKFEKIIREEMEHSGCFEILMPMVQPASLWKQSGRWSKMSDTMLRFKNRSDQEFCLGPTHEEVTTDFAKSLVKSYRDMPLFPYQIQTKYRDEIRPRFGLLRCREFIMKDAYSFDTSYELSQQSYQKMYHTYQNIFSRLGVEYVVVDADSGDIGGSRSQEFHLLAAEGEDTLLVVDGFSMNKEICPVLCSGFSQEVKNLILDKKVLYLDKEAGNQLSAAEGSKKSMIDKSQSAEVKAPMKYFDDFLCYDKNSFKEKGVFDTPNVGSIASLAKLLSVKESELVKTLFLMVLDEEGHDRFSITVLLRGDRELNLVKLKNGLGVFDFRFLKDKEVLELTGANPGSCGPVGVSTKIYMDTLLLTMNNYVVGANETGKHLKNVNLERDFQITGVGDFSFAEEGDLSPEGSILKKYKGIELGHIFYLGTSYSKKMDTCYLNELGKGQPIEMGCYGIGVSRTIQAVIEQCHDKDGMIWPRSIAPFLVHLCLLDVKSKKFYEIAEAIYNTMIENGFDCLWDDRDERPGVKFKDADLLGMPLRIVVGGRGLEKGHVEFVSRKTREKTLVALENILPEAEIFFKE